MLEVKTWAEFGALSKEDLDALNPEELDTLKKSIAENEAKTASDRETELKKNKELADNYKIRAEKAEKKAKKGDDEKGGVDENHPNLDSKLDSLSTKDIIALQRANIEEEDIDEVLGYAKYRKVSVAEVLKDKTLKTILSERVEERKSAQVANTGHQSGTSKVTGEALLEEAKKGNVPDSDQDIEKLVKARIEAKRAKS